MEQPSTKEINFPAIGRKVEIIVCMKEISDPYIFHELFLKKNEQNIYNLYDLLVEDLELYDPPPGRTDFLLLGEIESYELKVAAFILKEIVQEVGCMQKNHLYASHQLWTKFIASTTSALRSLTSPR